jgi:hypothetical protein
MTTLPVRPTAPVPARSPALVSEIMGRVGSRDTEPEKLFRKALRRAGIRSFRACDATLPGKPDIVLPGRALRSSSTATSGTVTSIGLAGSNHFRV